MHPVVHFEIAQLKGEGWQVIAVQCTETAGRMRSIRSSPSFIEGRQQRSPAYPSGFQAESSTAWKNDISAIRQLTPCPEELR
jgi:hypothetical protein